MFFIFKYRSDTSIYKLWFFGQLCLLGVLYKDPMFASEKEITKSTNSTLICNYWSKAIRWIPALKNVNNCLKTNIYSYLDTSGGQSPNLYLNVVHFSTPVLIRHLWQLKTCFCALVSNMCCSIQGFFVKQSVNLHGGFSCKTNKISCI